MARRRWYRRSVRVVPAKKKWASNIKTGTFDSANPTIVLGENSSQASNPTPTIVKVGNYKIQGDLSVSASTANVHISGNLFLVFVPEGNLTSLSSSMSDIIQFVVKHPEYLMAWCALDLPISVSGTVGGSKFSLSSRLKRNLNSGDRVMLLLYNDTDIPVTINYTATYFTCAN